MYQMCLALAVVLCLARSARCFRELPSKQVDVSKFTVTNLSVEAIPLSHRVEYSLFVQVDPSLAAAECSALGTNLDESLNSITMTPCNTGTGLSFEWIQFANGSAELVVVHNVSSLIRDTATRAIAKSDIATVATGTEFAHQVYVGPSNFSMVAVRGP